MNLTQFIDKNYKEKLTLGLFANKKNVAKLENTSLHYKILTTNTTSIKNFIILNLLLCHENKAIATYSIITTQ